MTSTVALRSVVILACGLCSSMLQAAEPGFRRFAETISPDGAYVLAWGWRTKGEDLAKLKEWPEGKDTFDEGTTENYLVDAVQGRVLVVIPGFEYFRGTSGHENHGGISVGWSMDSHEALAIYDGKWSNRALVWIRPATRTCIDVEKPLTGAYRRLLQSREKRPEPGGISFHDPAILPGSVLVTYGWAQIPKEDPVFHYRLRFQMKFEEKKATCVLVNGRSIPDAGEEPDDEAALNAVYGKLRAGLNDAGRAALKKEEEAWLKQREAIEDEMYQKSFTSLRVSYLRARLGK
jgi:hypothetical protein